MKSREQIAVLRRAAEQIRGLADQLPDAADELREMASDLDAEARRQGKIVRHAVYRQEAVLSGSVYGQPYRRS